MKVLYRTTIFLFLLAVGAYLGVRYYYNTTFDLVSPTLTCSDEVLNISVKDGKEVMLQGITATDNVDGDLTDQIMIQGISRLLTADTAKVTYVVFDSSNNMASCTRTIRYTDYERPRIQLSSPPIFMTYPQGDAITELSTLFEAQDLVDGDISDRIQISSMDINSSFEGTYSAVVQVVNSLGDVESVPIKVVISNSGAQNPVIRLTQYIAYVNQSSIFNPSNYILSSPGAAYVNIESNVDTSTPGCYQVRYSCDAPGQTYEIYLAVVVR